MSVRAAIFQTLDSARRLTLGQRLAIAGLLAGISSGLAAFAFHEAIGFIHDRTIALLPLSGPWRLAGLVALPAIGAGAAVLLIRYLSPAAGGHGVNEVASAIRDGGHIPGNVGWVKLIASALTIGSGGSAGREGPIIQIGGAVGSSVGRWLGLASKDLRVIIAAGATAGLGASFGVPLAAVFFTMEVLLPELGGESFAAVVIASTVGAVTAETLLSGQTFVPLTYRGATLGQMTFFAVLGLLISPLGILYMRSVDAVERFLEHREYSVLWTAPAGGALVGALAWLWPEVLGTSQGAIEASLHGSMAPGRAAAVSIAKLAATSATLGGGAPGGAFMPAMVIGSSAGAACAGGAHALGFAVDPSSFALAGMAAAIASSYGAPVTAIVMALEMSRDYDALPAVMLTVAVATLVARSRVRRPEPVLEQ